MSTFKKINGLILLIMSFSSYGQSVESRKHIYRLSIHKQSKTSTYFVIQTGFKVKDYAGIFTALHGFTGPDQILDLTIENRYFESMAQKESYKEIDVLDGNAVRSSLVNIDSDLIFIPVSEKKLSVNEGLVVSKAIPTNNASIRISGHLSGISVQDQVENPFPTINETAIPLTSIISSDAQTSFKERGSPLNTLSVISINGILGPGYSGAPVLLNNEVIGVLDGGLKSSNKAWATNIMALTLDKKQPGSSAKQPLPFDKIKNKMLNNPPFTQKPDALFAIEHIEEQSSLNERKINKRKLRLPDWSFGFTLNYAKSATGAWGEPLKGGAALDVYLEKQLWGRLYGGIYASSSHLAYEIIRRSNENLPLLQATSAVRSDHLFDLAGINLNLSLLNFNRVNLLIGAGGLGGLPKTGLRENYRAYLEGRIYPMPSRRLAVQLKAIYSAQVVETYGAFRLGNASLSQETIKSLYVCAGINFSYYR